MFLYTNNKLSEKQIIPFTIASRAIKYIGINLTKEVKYLYIENHKTLMREIEEARNKWKVIPSSWIGRILLKCPYCPKPSIGQM